MNFFNYITAIFKEIFAGLADEKTSPGLIKIIYFIGRIVLVIAVCYLAFPAMLQIHKGNIESFDNQLKITTDTIREFDESLAKTNSDIMVLKTKENATESEQDKIRNTLMDHEKRITRIEAIQNKVRYR